MNILCLLRLHKYPYGASAKYRGLGYNRYEWQCQRKGCKHRLSMKEKADAYGWPIR